MDVELICPNCKWKLRDEKVDREYLFRCTICGTLYDSDLKVVDSDELENPDDNAELLVDIFNDPRIPPWKMFLSFFGMPLEEGAYAVSSFPYISMLFVISSVGIFFFFPKAPPYLALNPEHVFRYYGLTLVTYSLVHANIWHLLVNMWFVFPFMDSVEDKLGPLNCFLFIICSALGSAALHVYFSHSNELLVGASGVCFAYAAIFAFMFPMNRFLIPLPFLGPIGLRYQFRIPAFFLIFIFIGIEVFHLLPGHQGTVGVSHLGHVGGAAIGILFGFLGT